MLIRSFVAVLLALYFQVGLAQPFPSKPVRIVNPYAAGGPTDLVARALAEGMSAELGQQVIVEPRPGGGTVIGADVVAKSAADGYTLLAATLAPVIVQPLINPQLPYNADRDFVPVGLYATIPNLITVHPSVPANNVKEFIEYAKKQGGKVTYASAGNGTGPHLAGELFKSITGVDMTHVPYKGAAPGVLDVLSGNVQVSFLNITPQVPHVKAGKLRALGLASAKRSSLLPDVPTMIEAGIPGYIAESWNGVLAPAGTPRAVIDTLSRAMLKVMDKPESRERFLKLGADVTPLGPTEFAAYLKADQQRLTPIIRSLGLKPD